MWRSRRRGCDAFYYLLCVEEYRRLRRLPIVLPDLYLLDEPTQLYPPGFTIFLSWLPEKQLRRGYWLITPLTDTVITLLLYVLLVSATYREAGETYSAFIATVGALAYSLAWPVLTDTSNLNSRPLGNLLLVGLMLMLVQYEQSGYWLWLLGAGAVGYLIVMTHKLTTQLLVVMLPGIALAMWSWGPAAVLGIAVLISLIVSRGMLVRILKGQLDILKFWNRNWRNLGAHQVLSSPMYGDETRKDLGRVFQPGWKGWLGVARHLAANIFLLPTGVVVTWMVVSEGMTRTETVMVWWIGLTYGLAALTMLIPRLRFYGEGYKYLRFAVFPVAFIGGSGLARIGSWWAPGRDPDPSGLFYGALGILAFLTALAVIVARQKANNMLNPTVDGDLGKVLEYLKRPEVTAVLSIPTHLADAVAYYCRKPVVWGTHSAGFENVEPMFPVLRERLDWFVQKYQVSHIVLDEQYLQDLKSETLLGASAHLTLRSGRYSVHAVSSAEQVAQNSSVA